jgi:hypothetical protein
MPAIMAPGDGLPEEVIQGALKTLEEMLREPNVQVHLYRSVKRTTQPGDAWESYAPGVGRCIIVEIQCGIGEWYDTGEPRSVWPRPRSGDL